MNEVTNHLWQSTLFAIAAGLMTLAFRKNRAQVRYWLWFSASVKFLIPFWLLMTFSSHLAWTPAAKKVATSAPAVSLAMIQMSDPFSNPFAPVPAPPQSTGWAPIAIIVIWVCGFAVIVLMRLRKWVRIRAAVRASTVIDLPAGVEVRSSPGLLEPGVVGLFRPILLLPAGILERLTSLQLEAVLAHELSHVRRRDNLFASIHMIVEAIFWFHPLVWWIGAKLVQERERTCDEAVLSLGSEPRDYADGILSVCKLYIESTLRCVSGVTGSNIKKRIEAIMKNRILLRLNFAKKAALAAAGMASLSLPIIVGMMNAPAIRAQSAPASTPRFQSALIRACTDEPSVRRGAAVSSPGTLNTGCDLLAAKSDSIGLIQRAYIRFADGRFNGGAVPNLIPIVGGPAWINSDLYEISAQAKGSPSQEMMQGPMLQALLEDRFGLKVHRETREVPVYALTVGDDGSKLTPFNEGSCVFPPSIFPPAPPVPGQKYCKILVRLGGPAVDAEGVTLDAFSKLLDLVLDRPVIDTTGVAGRFDIYLKFAPDQSTPRLLLGGDAARFLSADARNAEPISLALQHQLGLTLVPSFGPEQFLVIDHIERPSGN